MQTASSSSTKTNCPHSTAVNIPPTCSSDPSTIEHFSKTLPATPDTAPIIKCAQVHGNALLLPTGWELRQVTI
jgi:hypothetical protein